MKPTQKWLGPVTASWPIFLLVRFCIASWDNLALVKTPSLEFSKSRIHVLKNFLMFPTLKVCNAAGFIMFHLLCLLAAGATTFSTRRQMWQGDVLVLPPGLVLLIKWSKTRESPGHPLPLPAVPGHPLCSPVRKVFIHTWTRSPMTSSQH